MREQKLLFVLAQSLIGTGFFFLYVEHLRSIFESRSNIAHLSQLERESLFRREDALYYSFYKTLTEEPDFWSGYEKLKNVTSIEYPHSVNVLQRFHVLPELTIAYLYHLLRHYNSGSTSFLFFNCWRTNDAHIPLEHRRCDVHSQPLQFYLEIVWLLGGMTILIIYMYGTLLSENIFGGIYAVVSYIMFHSFAAKIYERPVARENFAFPILFLQMFYLCLCMDRVHEQKQHRTCIFVTLKLALLTAISLLCWQFSAIVFASQLLILLTPCWNLDSPFHKAFNKFSIDYALSQLFGTALAYYWSQGNKEYLYAWQLNLGLGLLFVSIVQHVKQPTRQSDASAKLVALGLLVTTSAQVTLIDLLEKVGFLRPQDNTFTLYRDLSLHWLLQAKVSFVSSLAACNPAYARMDWTQLWELIKTLIVKPYCMYGVVMLAKFFRKWRKSGEKRTPSEELKERARKYVLEDFLEENRISMQDMSNKETEDELNECLKLLEQCDYVYERYCTEKSKLKQQKPDTHSEFMNDIRKLKQEIHELNDKQHSDNAAAAAAATSLGSTPNPTSVEQNKKPSKGDAETAAPEPVNGNSRRPRAAKAAGNSKRVATAARSASSTAGCATGATSATSTSLDPEQARLFSYIYSLMQMFIFTVIGLSVKKLFFICFTQGCVIAPTLCCKFWYRKQRNIFWSVSLAVFLTSMFDPGIVNIREEYFPTRYAYGNDDLDTMLEWIKMNTEKDAVFAGPIDIIGTVHLTTRRPIVNHAHLEMRQISDRTEHVYSLYSRQQSSDIYNQCSQMKIQYLIISLQDCTNENNDDCDLLSIWDDMQPAYRKYPQFCAELVNKNVPSFLKVFANEYYGIIKMFSQSVQINLKYSKMPEKVM